MFHWELQLSASSQTTPEELSAQGFDLTFPSQGEAELWLGENYMELQEAGVESVTLVEGERTVYGPMSLESA